MKHGEEDEEEDEEDEEEDARGQQPRAKDGERCCCAHLPTANTGLPVEREPDLDLCRNAPSPFPNQLCVEG